MSFMDRIADISQRVESIESRFGGRETPKIDQSNMAQTGQFQQVGAPQTSFSQIYQSMAMSGPGRIDSGQMQMGFNPNMALTPTSGGGNNQFDSIINSAAMKYGVDPNLVKGIIKQESAFNPNAQSYCGAQGLMQLMPDTARELGVQNSYDPAQNIEGGTKYIRKLLDRFNGDVKMAVAAYNAGPGAVEKFGGIPPYEETQNYVTKVLGNYSQYRSGT